MKRSMMLLAMTLCGTAVAQTAPPAAMTQQEQKARQEIQSALDGYERAWNRHDATGMASYFAEDARLVNPFGQKAEGRAGIEKFFKREQEGFLKTTRSDFQVERLRMLSPTMAFVDAAGHLTGIQNPDGTPAPDMNVNLSFVGVKRGETWQILDGRAHSYLPPPTMSVGGAGEEGTEPVPAPETVDPGPTY